jgi:hypothetical protein
VSVVLITPCHSMPDQAKAAPYVDTGWVAGRRLVARLPAESRARQANAIATSGAEHYSAQPELAQRATKSAGRGERVFSADMSVTASMPKW